jgi:hypothetical protein
LKTRHHARVRIPEQLQLLCDILNITPKYLLECFAQDVTLEDVAEEKAGYEQSKDAISYFMNCTERYTRRSRQQIQDMFEELIALLKQWPGDNDREKEKRYPIYRKAFLKV